MAKRLLEHGADIDARDAKGSTPLHVAAFVGRRDIAALLLQAGADRLMRDNAYRPASGTSRLSDPLPVAKESAAAAGRSHCRPQAAAGIVQRL